MKICSNCGATEVTARFYAGNRGRCAACWREEVNLNRRLKVDFYREQDRKRWAQKPRRKHA